MHRFFRANRFLFLRFVCAGIGTVFSGVGSAIAQDQISDFIGAFSQTCQSMGRFTQDALELTDLYIDTITKLRDNEACKPLYNTLSKVEMLSRGLSRMRTNRDKYYKEASSNAFLEGFFSNMDFASDGMDINGFQLKYPGFGNLLSSVGRAYVASRGIALSRRQDELAQRQEDNAVLSRYITDLRQALTKSRTCLIGKPDMPAVLVSQTLALSGLIEGSQMGGALTVAGVTLNEIFEYFREKPFQDAIEQGMLAKFYPALSCGFEAMIDSYCRIADSRSLFEVQLATLLGVEDDKGIDFFEGLEVLSRNYPRLRVWFGKLPGGALADNPETATRNKRVVTKEARVRQVAQDISGVYGDTRREYENIPLGPSSEQDRKRVVQKFVNRITDIVFGYQPDHEHRAPEVYAGDDGNPYLDYFQTNPACMFAWSLYVGYDKVPTPSEMDPVADCDVQLNKVAEGVSDLTETKRNLDQLQSLITERVRREWTAIFGASFDPQKTWLEATDLDNLNRSHLKTFQNIRSYLGKLHDRWTHLLEDDPSKYHLRLQIKHLGDFRVQLDDVVKLIETPDPLDAQRNPMGYMSRINHVSSVFKLRDHFDYFIEKVLTFIDTDLSERIRNKEFDQSVTQLLQLASRDYVKAILGIEDGETIDTRKINDDLNNAIGLSQDTLDNYGMFFGKHVVFAIRYFIKKSEKNRESRAPPTRAHPLADPMISNASKLCVLALAVHDDVIKKHMISKGSVLNMIDWKKLGEVCKSLTYYTPIYGETGLKLSFDDLQRKDWKGRVCAFYDLKEKNEIFNMHRIIQREDKNVDLNVLDLRSTLGARR